MDTVVRWQSGLSFMGSADSGFEVPLGTERSVGGNEDGFRPMELIATGLAGCTAMDVISILRKKRQDVTAFEVQVHTEKAQEHPKVFTSAVIHYQVTGHNLDEAALVRAIELSATRYCPAQAMLSNAFPMSLRYSIYEDLGDGSRNLVVSGQYQQVQSELQGS